jgi:hypothetical protein
MLTKKRKRSVRNIEKDERFTNDEKEESFRNIEI